VTLIRWRWF